MMERFVQRDRDDELAAEPCTGEGSQAGHPDWFLLLSLQAAGTMGEQRATSPPSVSGTRISLSHEGLLKNTQLLTPEFTL